MVSKGLIASITASFTIAGAAFLGSFTENIFSEANDRIHDALNGNKVSTERIISESDVHNLENIVESMEMTVAS